MWQKVGQALRALWSWRAAAGAGFVSLGACVVWLMAQVSALGDLMDSQIARDRSARDLRNQYANEFREGDPTKRDFLNDVVYRVRMRVIEPEEGADLLCWLAARASIGDRSATGPLNGATSQNIISFLDRHAPMFRLEKRTGLWDREAVTATIYCAPYLSSTLSQPDQAPSDQMGEALEAASVATGDGGEAPIRTDQRIADAPAPQGRLFVHVGQEGQRGDADAVGRSLALALERVDYQSVELIAGYAGRNEVRYYKPEDRELAIDAADVLTCEGDQPRVVRVRGYETTPWVKPATLELWVRSGAGCALKPQGAG